MFSHGQKEFFLFGALALVLGGGDAFHLIPRIKVNLVGRDEKSEFYLGLGKAITSVTMTVFYLILLWIYKTLFPSHPVTLWMLILIYGCAAFRIVVCFFPGNHWFDGKENLTFSLLRNVPFLILGVLEMVLFGMAGMPRISIAMAISFACYIPVTLFAKKVPMLGMLMMPKTLAYVWMIAEGLALLTF